MATSLGLVGYVKNTDRGTVVGVAQGKQEAVDTFKHWLAHTGSPQSQIERMEVHQENEIPELTFSSFEIIRKPKPTSQ
jgi:acylphosphatase